mmetsp:Transcript_18562/g.45588  ORF Transcript_18562/g.45588 Transcript_18562/m.45588 type:complete len:241 (+) Transcript_18562:1689-2411(+)
MPTPSTSPSSSVAKSCSLSRCTLNSNDEGCDTSLSSIDVLIDSCSLSPSFRLSLTSLVSFRGPSTNARQSPALMYTRIHKLFSNTSSILFERSLKCPMYPLVGTFVCPSSCSNVFMILPKRSQSVNRHFLISVPPTVSTASSICFTVLCRRLHHSYLKKRSKQMGSTLDCTMCSSTTGSASEMSACSTSITFSLIEPMGGSRVPVVFVIGAIAGGFVSIPTRSPILPEIACTVAVGLGLP